MRKMDSDYTAPPPAYTEQEFDQKVSQATTLSILTPTPTFDEEGWERYDPRAFERPPMSPSRSGNPSGVGNGSAAFSSSSYADGSGSQYNQPNPQNHDKSNLINNLPAIVPLRIEKRSQPQIGKTVSDLTYPQDKASLATRQNGKSNAGSSGTASSFPSGYYGGSIPQHSHDQQSSTHPSLYPEPSPLMERTSSYAPNTPVVAPVYQEGGEEEHYDPYRDYQTPPQPQPYVSSRQSLPAIPQSAPQRPTHTHSRSRSEAMSPHSVPRLQFDPSVAYGKSNSTPVTAIQAIHGSIPVSPIPAVQYDPHSLYNSTVSSKMIPIRPSQGDVYYQAPSYDHQGQNMGYPLRTGQQLQFANDPGRNSRHLVVDNSRQSAWQTPSRPTSTYPMSTTPQPTDVNRFSQYSTSTSSRDSVYSNQNDWYPSR